MAEAELRTTITDIREGPDGIDVHLQWDVVVGRVRTPVLVDLVRLPAGATAEAIDDAIRQRGDEFVKPAYVEAAVPALPEAVRQLVGRDRRLADIPRGVKA